MVIMSSRFSETKNILPENIKKLLALLKKEEQQPLGEWKGGRHNVFCIIISTGDFTLKIYQDADSETRERLYAIPDRHISTRIDDSSGEVYALTNTIISSLHGNSVEMDTAMMERVKPASDGFWYSWKFEGVAETYRKAVYPVMRKALMRCAADIAKDKKEIVVADLFCSDGEFLVGEEKREGFVHKAASLLPHRTFTYHLVDKNLGQIALAQKRYSTARVPADVFIHERDVVRKGFPDGVRPDVVTAVGGFNQGVLTQEDAVAAVKKVHTGMNTGGMLVVTGITPCLLNAEMFSQNGFDVLNRSIPKNIVSRPFIQPLQLYVMRKE